MNAPRAARTRRVPGWLLFLLLVVMPLLELFVLIRVGKVIGAGSTILLLILAAVVGAWVVRREGARAWQAFNGALGAGRMPTKELADGVMVLAGGVLMMAPGVVSDLMGLVLVLPFTRPLVRPLLVAAIAPRIKQSMASSPLGGFATGFGGDPFAQDPFAGQQEPRDARRPGPQDGGPVIRGEVVDD
ncbi:FxsA family protein [Nocardioides yefusunii]|uniref:FxsA family protein n=1 Tax=Nocardioides yefusunii TaxID=2500546 RepID=A0ABW1QUD9_9ACTN|nr:FxsA family protein [Nocardioides yefusunii]